MKTILLYLICTCVIGSAYAPQSKPTAIAMKSDTVAGIQLYARLDRNTYSPADKILLELILTNTTENAVIIKSGIPEIVYEINMKYVDDMQTAKRTQYGQYMVNRARMSSSKPIQVPGHGYIKQFITLNRIYDMTLAGTYLLNIHRGLGIPGKGTAESVKVDEMPVVVYEKTGKTFTIKTSPSL